MNDMTIIACDKVLYLPFSSLSLKRSLCMESKCFGGRERKFIKVDPNRKGFSRLFVAAAVLPSYLPQTT